MRRTHPRSTQRTRAQRRITGEQHFVYEYVPKEQPPNLIYLSAVSGAGRSFVVPELAGPLAKDDHGVAWNCIALARELLQEGKASRQGELAAMLRKLDDDFLVASDTSISLASVESAMAENIVCVLEKIDAAEAEPLLDLMLVGTAGYELSRGDWPKMLTFVNESLPRPRQLDWTTFEASARSGAEDAFEKQWISLRGRVDYLPFMGFSILIHAVRHEIDKLLLREDEPEIFSEGFWESVRDWHGWSDEATESADPRERFARGLVEHFAGRSTAARRILSASKKAGDARAERYLAILGKSER